MHSSLITLWFFLYHIASSYINTKIYFRLVYLADIPIESFIPLFKSVIKYILIWQVPQLYDFQNIIHFFLICLLFQKKNIRNASSLNFSVKIISLFIVLVLISIMINILPISFRLQDVPGAFFAIYFFLSKIGLVR